MHSTSIERAQENVDELRRQLKEEVVADVRKETRRRAWRSFFIQQGCGCCGGLLVVLAIAGAVAYLVVRSGVITVPFLSQRIRHERAPARVVSPAPVRSEQLFASRLRSAARVPSRDGTIEISFTEPELTALLRETMASNEAFASAAKTAQAVVRPDGLEIFSRFPAYGVAETTLLIFGKPVIKDRRLEIELRDVAVGNLQVPSFLRRSFAAAIQNRLPPLPVERIMLSEGAARVFLRASGL